jgi:hypothetical protein
MDSPSFAIQLDKSPTGIDGVIPRLLVRKFFQIRTFAFNSVLTSPQIAHVKTLAHDSDRLFDGLGHAAAVQFRQVEESEKVFLPESDQETDRGQENGRG